MNVDLLIVGSGFGGSVLAMVARSLGYTVLMLERGKHPRFAIGESTSPLTNLLIETLSERYHLPRLAPLATWGAWKAAYPQLGVGLKRGFTYYGHAQGQPFVHAPDRANRLLVAASPDNPCADTHWLREDVDHFLAREAVAAGADLIENARIDHIEPVEGGWDIGWTCEDDPKRTTARMVVDAGGAPGPLAQALGLVAGEFPGYPATQALYTHLENVPLAADLPSFAEPGALPYPPDWSALHHVFDGGWMWVLRFDNHRVSAGFACEDWLAQDLGLSDGAPAWERFLDRFPSIREQFGDAVPMRPWVHAPRLSFRMDRAAGSVDGSPWALLPSAAGFVDPLYSTGFSLTLAGIERLGKLLENCIPDEASLRQWENTVLRDRDWVAEFIAANYASFGNFPRFVETSQFYFAAASFTEMARRLGNLEMAPGVLLSGCAPFRDAFQKWRTTPGMTAAEAIEPWNIAGLADPAKHNAYGVDLGDVVRGASKLGWDSRDLEREIADAQWAKCDGPAAG